MVKVTRAYQHFILGTLVVLWGGVLPWLCWGGWSNPHHPHANPHFVFAAPPLLDESSHLHASPLHTHTSDAQKHGAPQADINVEDALAGVARPDTLLIALLVLVLPASRVLLVPRQRHFARHFALAWAHATTLIVPTPPPRCCLSFM